MTTKPEIDELKQRIAELEAAQAKSGIHPAKKPGPFKMETFLSGLDEETLKALGDALEESEPDPSLQSQWITPERYKHPKPGWYWVKWGQNNEPRPEEWNGKYWDSANDDQLLPYSYYPHPIPEPPEMK